VDVARGIGLAFEAEAASPGLGCAPCEQTEAPCASSRWSKCVRCCPPPVAGEEGGEAPGMSPLQEGEAPEGYCKAGHLSPSCTDCYNRLCRYLRGAVSGAAGEAAREVAQRVAARFGSLPGIRALDACLDLPALLCDPHFGLWLTSVTGGLHRLGTRVAVVKPGSRAAVGRRLSWVHKRLLVFKGVFRSTRGGRHLRQCRLLALRVESPPHRCHPALRVGSLPPRGRRRPGGGYGGRGHATTAAGTRSTPPAL
jgi:hypothetical protein